MLSPDLTTLLSVALLVFAGWPGTTGRSRWPGRLIAFVLLSPALRYLSALFMFPIRLHLSAWAGCLLRLSGTNVQVEGNVLFKNGFEMAVDPACMGLQLTGVSLLVAVFLLIWQERQTCRAVPVRWVVVYGFVTFGLTVLCNLFRIILLVMFGAMPGTGAHEGIGLVCVVAYAWLPAWGLARWLVHQTGRLEKTVQAAPSSMLKSAGWGIGLLITGLSILAFTGRPNQSALTDRCASATDSSTTWYKYGRGCSCKTLANGTVQLTKPGVLIYLKPQFDWFSADHSPMACWPGSGYDLQRVRETVLDGHPAYVGKLHKQGQALYTAWWFSNGTVTTVSQLTMRKQMLRGQTGFMLVNVTVDNERYTPDFTQTPELHHQSQTATSKTD